MPCLHREPQHGSRRSRSSLEVAAGGRVSRGATEHMSVEAVAVEDVLIVISEYLPVIVVVLLVY